MTASKQTNRPINALQGTGGRLTKAYQRIRVNEAPGMIQALKSGDFGTIGSFFSGRISWHGARGGVGPMGSQLAREAGWSLTPNRMGLINKLGRNRKIGAGLVGGVALLGIGNLLGSMFGNK